MAHGDGGGARSQPPRVDHLPRLGAPSAVGLDETSFLAATAERCERSLEVVFGDQRNSR
jgi:hypothetical protein